MFHNKSVHREKCGFNLHIMFQNSDRKDLDINLSASVCGCTGSVLCVYVCVCAFVLAGVCFQGSETQEGGFKLTEHASASTRSNYCTTKGIRGVAPEVRGGINACFKDDLLSTWINFPT